MKTEPPTITLYLTLKEAKALETMFDGEWPWKDSAKAYRVTDTTRLPLQLFASLKRAAKGDK